MFPSLSAVIFLLLYLAMKEVFVVLRQRYTLMYALLNEWHKVVKSLAQESSWQWNRIFLCLELNSLSGKKLFFPHRVNYTH